MEQLIDKELYDRLSYLGLIPNDIRKNNVGKSNYSKHTIQPWSIWLDYPELTPWDDDIIKRILRTKEESGMSEKEARVMDYEKIIHICNERIRQLKFNKFPSEQELTVFFPLSGTELEKYNTFVEKHKHCNGQVVKQLHYKSGIGPITEVHCSGCNVTEDITDYSKW